MSIRFVRHRNDRTISALAGLKLIAQIRPCVTHYEITFFDNAGATVRETQDAISEEEALEKVIAYVVAQRLESA